MKGHKANYGKKKVLSHYYTKSWQKKAAGKALN